MVAPTEVVRRCGDFVARRQARAVDDELGLASPNDAAFTTARVISAVTYDKYL